MTRGRLIPVAMAFYASMSIWAHNSRAAESVELDLVQWPPPDIATVGDDPFGILVKYG